MYIAVPEENGEVFQHFGKSERFEIFEIENERILSRRIMPVCGSGHDSLAQELYDNKVEVLICGGIGAGAKSRLRIKGIEFIPGVRGSIDTAIKKYLSGERIGDENYVCGHSDENNGCENKGSCGR